MDFDPADMERAGRTLYGDQWQTNLARALNVDPRRVRQWMSGERKPQPGVISDIIELLDRNREAAAETAGHLRGKYFTE